MALFFSISELEELPTAGGAEVKVTGVASGGGTVGTAGGASMRA